MSNTNFYEYCNFSQCKSSDDIVREIKKWANLDSNINLSDKEDKAKQWLLQPFVDEDEDTSGIEIYKRDNVFRKTIRICDEGGVEKTHDVTIDAYFIDPGSVEYAYVYRICELDSC